VKVKVARGAPPSPERLSITDFARRVGASSKSVTGAIERGDIPPECVGEDGHGRRAILDAAAAEAAYRQMREPKPVVPAGVGDELPPGLDFENPETWPRDLDGLKVVREWWIARHAKRKDDIAAGELVRVELVRREITTAARTVRDHLLRIPDRAAEDIAAECGIEDASAVRRVLRAAIERGLSDLSTALEHATEAEPESEAFA
jgi:hypothetical protein